MPAAAPKAASSKKQASAAAGPKATVKGEVQIDASSSKKRKKDTDSHLASDPDTGAGAGAGAGAGVGVGGSAKAGDDGGAKSTVAPLVFVPAALVQLTSLPADTTKAFIKVSPRPTGRSMLYAYAEHVSRLLVLPLATISSIYHV